MADERNNESPRIRTWISDVQPEKFSWVNAADGTPCPTRGEVLCTITDPDHLHVAAHMYEPAPPPPDTQRWGCEGIKAKSPVGTEVVLHCYGCTTRPPAPPPPDTQRATLADDVWGIIVDHVNLYLVENAAQFRKEVYARLSAPPANTEEDRPAPDVDLEAVAEEIYDAMVSNAQSPVHVGERALIGDILRRHFGRRQV